MLTHGLAVFRFEFLRQIRRRAYLFTTFSLPLLALLILIGYTVYQEATAEDDSEASNPLDAEIEGSDPVGYVDLSGLFAPPVESDFLFDYLKLFETVEAGQTALENEDINALYVIAEDYLETGEVASWLQEGALPDNSGESIIETYLLLQLADDTPLPVVSRLRAPIVTVTEQTLTASGEADTREEGNFTLVYIFALSIMITVFGASGYLMQSVAEEKENRTIEIVLTSVKPLPLLVGKTLAMGLAGLLQIALWMLSIFLLSRTFEEQISGLISLDTSDITPTMLLIALIYFLLGYGFMGGFMAGLGALVNTTREGSAYAGIVTFPLIVPLFFLAVFIDDPNGTLATAMSLIPFTAPLAMVMRISAGDVPTGEILLSIALLSLVVVLMLWLAARLFRAQSLLRGTTPRLRDIPALLFER